MKSSTGKHASKNSQFAHLRVALCLYSRYTSLEMKQDENSQIDSSKKLKTDLYQFQDYRSFLTAIFDEKKKKNTQWSFQAWAKILGLKNNSSLLKILRGQREAGPEITEKLSKYFEFRGRKKEYFEDLIRLSKAAKKDERLKVLLIEEIKAKHPKKNFAVIDDQTFSAISHWWFYGIRQLAKFKAGIKNDPETIAKLFRFKITPREISRAIKTLKKLGLLKEVSSHHENIAHPPLSTFEITLRATSGGLDTSDGVANEALKRFHEEALELAKQSIRNTSHKERSISSCTLAAKKEDFPEANKMIREFQDKFCERFQSDDGNEVYQFQTQFFPLTNHLTHPSRSKK